MPEHVYGNGELSEYSARNSMQLGAADLMILSLAHIHVISATSGFGQKAAFLSSSKYRNHVYLIPRHDACGVMNFVNPTWLAQHWSGI